MNDRLTAATCAILTLLYAPAMALAQEESEIVDARLESYGTNVSLPPTGTALLWILLVFLGAICVGVMFKDAKRSHLD